jgi:uncharacterized membrane protein YuzA (DUF378 family)
MDSLTIARALHVLAIVHCIGGVSMVTLVILPGLSRGVPAFARLGLFEAIEGRFAKQARISTLVAGLTGLYMAYRLRAWDRRRPASPQRPRSLPSVLRGLLHAGALPSYGPGCSRGTALHAQPQQRSAAWSSKVRGRWPDKDRTLGHSLALLNAKRRVPPSA